MTIQVSTGFKSLILGPHSFTDIFNRGAILVFEGPRPAYADMALPSEPLGMVTRGGLPWAPPATGAGLLFEQSGPYVANPTFDPWVLTVARPGVATWARLVGPDPDPGFVDYDLPRIDFDVGDDAQANPDWLIPNATLEPGQTIRLSNFLYTIPPLIPPGGL